MKMVRRGGRLLVLALAFVLPEVHGAPRLETFRASAKSVSTRVVVEVPEATPRGLLVVAEGSGKVAQPLAADDPWRKFAGENRWALAVVAIDDPEIAREETAAKPSSDVVVEARTAEALLTRALVRMRVENLPLYLFGFRKGGNFVLRAVDAKVGKVAAWACLGASQFPPIARETPYGIVAAADLDEMNYDAARRYATGLRERGAEATWISLPGRVGDSAKVGEFARKSFAAMENPNRRAVVVDNDRKEVVTAADTAGTTSVLPAMVVLQDWVAIHQPNPVITMTVQTGLKEFPEMTFALRLPRTVKHPRILAYSYHFTDVGKLLKNARNDGFVWNRYAAEQGLAVVTWNVQTLWQNLRSFDEISNRNIVKQNHALDAVARAWESGIVRLAKEHGLKDHGILLYGCSRGANFAIRLAMRDSKRLSAVVAHVANSFERPSPVVSNVVWAITNGELDPGAINAKRYYDQCRELGLPVFLRFFSGLGHSESEESLGFARDFFDYVRTEDVIGGKFAVGLARELKAPKYVADLTNYLVFNSERKGEVPVEQQIALPNERMARMWGRIPMDPTKAAAGPSDKLPPPKVPAGAASLLGKNKRVDTTFEPAPLRDRKTSVVEGSYGTTTLRYDDHGRLATIEYSDGAKVFYEYDKSGRPESFTIVEGAASKPTTRKIPFRAKPRE